MQDHAGPVSIALLAGAGTASTATQAVIAPAAQSASADNILASLEALLTASKAKEPVRLNDRACAQMAVAQVLLVLVQPHWD